LVHQASVNPGAFGRFLQVRRQVAHRGGAARQRIQRPGEIGRESRVFELEMFQDSPQVGILQLQNLLQPVHQLDVRIAPHLAEHRRALDGLVKQAVQFPKKCGAADLGHCVLLG